jgi:glycogen synthase
MNSEVRIRLLIYTPFFHPSVGGIESFTDGLAGELQRRGLDVRVLAATPLGPASELDRPYQLLRTGNVRTSDALFATDVLLSLGPSTRPLLPAWRQGVPFVLNHTAPAGDCPVAIGWRDGRACRFGLPRCLTCDVSGQSWASNVRNLARFGLLRWGMRKAAANVFVSDSLRRRVGTPGQVIGNFFEPLYRPNNTLADPVFTFVGRLVPVKGVDVAVRAFALAQRRGLTHRLRIVGEGPERLALAELARQEGVASAVEFLPFAKGPDLADIYRQSYALLFPSQWEEPFGMVLAEALACGTPVIASAHGAPPEVVGDAGILVPAADVAAWSAAMLSLAADPARRKRLAECAADRVTERFSLPAIGQAYHALLEEVVGNHAPTHSAATTSPL